MLDQKSWIEVQLLWGVFIFYGMKCKTTIISFWIFKHLSLIAFFPLLFDSSHTSHFMVLWKSQILSCHRIFVYVFPSILNATTRCTELSTLCLINFYSAYRLKLKCDFLKDFIYLFIFREMGREGEREGEKHWCVVASCTLPISAGGPGMQLRHVAWLWIEPATLWFTGPRSIHWAIPARAQMWFFK